MRDSVGKMATSSGSLQQARQQQYQEDYWFKRNNNTNLSIQSQTRNPNEISLEWSPPQQHYYYQQYDKSSSTENDNVEEEEETVATVTTSGSCAALESSFQSVGPQLEMPPPAPDCNDMSGGDASPVTCTGDFDKPVVTDAESCWNESMSSIRKTDRKNQLDPSESIIHFSAEKSESIINTMTGDPSCPDNATFSQWDQLVSEAWETTTTTARSEGNQKIFSKKNDDDSDDCVEMDRAKSITTLRKATCETAAAAAEVVAWLEMAGEAETSEQLSIIMSNNNNNNPENNHQPKSPKDRSGPITHDDEDDVPALPSVRSVESPKRPKSILRNLFQKKSKQSTGRASFKENFNSGNTLVGNKDNQASDIDINDDDAKQKACKQSRGVVFGQVMVVEYSKKQAPSDCIAKDRWNAARPIAIKFSRPQIPSRRRRRASWESQAPPAGAADGFSRRRGSASSRRPPLRPNRRKSDHQDVQSEDFLVHKDCNDFDSSTLDYAPMPASRRGSASFLLPHRRQCSIRHLRNDTGSDKQSNHLSPRGSSSFMAMFPVRRGSVQQTSMEKLDDEHEKDADDFNKQQTILPAALQACDDSTAELNHAPLRDGANNVEAETGSRIPSLQYSVPRSALSSSRMLPRLPQRQGSEKSLTHPDHETNSAPLSDIHANQDNSGSDISPCFDRDVQSEELSVLHGRHARDNHSCSDQSPVPASRRGSASFLLPYRRQCSIRHMKENTGDNQNNHFSRRGSSSFMAMFPVRRGSVQQTSTEQLDDLDEQVGDDCSRSGNYRESSLSPLSKSLKSSTIKRQDRAAKVEDATANSVPSLPYSGVPGISHSFDSALRLCQQGSASTTLPRIPQRQGSEKRLIKNPISPSMASFGDHENSSGSLVPSPKTSPAVSCKSARHRGSSSFMPRIPGRRGSAHSSSLQETTGSPQDDEHGDRPGSPFLGKCKDSQNEPAAPNRRSTPSPDKHSNTLFAAPQASVSFDSAITIGRRGSTSFMPRMPGRRRSSVSQTDKVSR